MSYLESHIGPIIVTAASILVPVISQVPSASDSLIAGNAGWAGAGLLGLVLAWLLLVHLPSKDKQMAEKDKAKDAAIEKIVMEFAAESRQQREAHRKAIEDVCNEFRAQMASERATCEKNFQLIANSFEKLRDAHNGRD